MRPFCIASIGAILGIICGLYFSSIAFYIYAILIVLLYLFEKNRKEFAIFLLLIISFSQFIIFQEKNINKINEKYNSEEVNIIATVKEKVKEEDKRISYKLKLEKIASKNKNWKKDKEDKENLKDKENPKDKEINKYILLNLKIFNKKIELNYGDRIEISGIYNTPKKETNSGCFNYNQYLKTQNIIGIINSKSQNIRVIGENKKEGINTLIYSFKNNLINKVKKILPKDTANLCCGLLLGDKKNISKTIQEDFKKSNLSHMLAISGAHVSYIILGISFILKSIKINNKWANILLIIFLIFFMLLVGFTPSVTRACIMSIYILVSQLLFKKADIYQSLAISSFCILLINPYSILDIGFQLSFGGTIGIVLLNKRLTAILEKKVKNKEILNRKIVKYISQMLIVSLSANLVIIPIMMYHFETTSITFLISNVLASPIFAISLILSLIFLISVIIFTPFAKIISIILNPSLELLVKVANLSSKIPFSQILVPRPNIFQILIYYILLYICFSPTILIKLKDKYFKKLNIGINKTKKIISICLVCIIIFIQIFKVLPDNKLTINFIDVGQGDSTLITTSRGKHILIDGGGSDNSDYDIGEKTLIPYLLNKGILSLEYIMVSHFDTDHCGGLFTVLERLKVKNVIISKQGEDSKNFQKFLKIVKKKNINVIIAKAGNVLQIDNETSIKILFPNEQFISKKVLNNNSIVAKVCWKRNQKEFSILLTGDIESEAESKIIEQYGKTGILKSNILKVPHHGSNTSSTQEFVEMVQPQIVLIGVGEKNTFGHPSPEVIERYEKFGCKIYRTDLCGEISIRIVAEEKKKFERKIKYIKSK